MDKQDFVRIKRTTHRSRIRILAFELLCCFILSACTSIPQDQSHLPLSNTGRLPEPDLAIDIPSLSNCTQSDDSRLHLNSRKPVTIIVHGCFSSAGRFRALADVFAFHGQQAICFNYNDRDRLDNSSEKLITAIEKLSGQLHQPVVTVIGHSQGGLVARRALTGERRDQLEVDNSHIRLVTISTPFGGIKSSSHCGSRPLAWLSLGITKLICQIVTGSKYREIPPNSDFINAPGTLIPAVDKHLKIATDELGSCRRYNDRGDCVEDDFVFGLDEQTQPAIDNDTNLSSVIAKSGHVEIVGDGKTEPIKLVEILQQQRVLSPTLPGRAKELSHLMKQIYLDEHTK